MFEIFMLLGFGVYATIKGLYNLGKRGQQVVDPQPCNWDRQRELEVYFNTKRKYIDGRPLPECFGLVNIQELTRRQLEKEGYQYNKYCSPFDLSNYTFDEDGYIIKYHIGNVPPQR